MTARGENLALTGIRGVAALWVAQFQFCPSAAAHLGWPALGGAISTGFLGVDLFFILSTLTWLFIEKPGQAAGARIWVKIRASWPRKTQSDDPKGVLNAPQLRD